MKNINWNDVQEATERRDLPVGGYVAGICKATDEPAKERLNIEWEVAEGEFKGYWREQTASLVERGKLNIFLNEISDEKIKVLANAI